MKRVLIDANVLVEVLFSRRLSDKCAALLVNPLTEYAISALTVHIVWYLAERYKLPQASVDDLLSAWLILPITERTIQAARRRYDGQDFEDCLQAVCAEEGNCKEIISIDAHFKAYSHTPLRVTTIK